MAHFLSRKSAGISGAGMLPWDPSKETLVFILDTLNGAGPARSVPFSIVNARPPELAGQLLGFCKKRLLFPVHRIGAMEWDFSSWIGLHCGASPLCCLRAGRMLADFAQTCGRNSRLIVPVDSGSAERHMGELKAILRSRRDPSAFETLANRCSSHYFLVAGYIGSVFHTVAEAEPEGVTIMQDLENRSLQHCEN